MISGFVTAGGRSSRMGVDKAWLDLGGKSMIERVIAALRPAVSSCAVIANSPEYGRLGLPVYPDSRAGIGPLEAIRTALDSSRAPRAILVGCDLPFVTTDLFGWLGALEGDYGAVVPVGPDGRLEPLCAVYSRNALTSVTRIIESGGRKVSLLFDEVATRRVDFSEISHLPGAELFFLNVNTAGEYDKALEISLELKR